MTPLVCTQIPELPEKFEKKKRLCSVFGPVNCLVFPVGPFFGINLSDLGSGIGKSRRLIGVNSED